MNQNTQPIEKLFRHPSGALHLHHCFPTIQGEGPFAGTPATFVRLAGCNLQCPMCDTDYTSKRRTLGVADMLYEVKIATPERLRGNGRLVVITGGEPFRQNLTPFILELYSCGYRVQVETNGTLFLDDFPFDIATVVCSPKTPRINPELAARAHAFKFVVQEGSIDLRDGLPMTTMGQINQISVARPPAGSTAQIFVQPLDEQDLMRNNQNTAGAVESCLRFGYRLCIQTHKLCNLE